MSKDSLCDYGKVLEVDQVFDRELAAARLLAHMAWPDDAEKRLSMEAAFAATLAVGYADLIREDERSVKKDLAQSSYRDQLPPEALTNPARWFQQAAQDIYIGPLGGLTALSDAPSRSMIEREITAKLFDISSTGDIILIMACLDAHHNAKVRGGASVKKAIHVLCALSDDEQNAALKTRGYRTVNETSLKTAWRKQKSVAHLCGAYVATEELFRAGPNEPPAFYREDVFWIFGAVAKRLEEFATLFHPHGQEMPLIPASEMHLLPDDVFNSGEVSFRPLDDEVIAALETYKAPAAY